MKTLIIKSFLLLFVFSFFTNNVSAQFKKKKTKTNKATILNKKNQPGSFSQKPIIATPNINTGQIKVNTPIQWKRVAGTWKGKDGSTLIININDQTKKMEILAAAKNYGGQFKWVSMGTGQLMAGGRQSYLISWIDMAIGKRNKNGQCQLKFLNDKSIKILGNAKSFGATSYLKENSTSRSTALEGRVSFSGRQEKVSNLRSFLSKQHGYLSGVWQTPNDEFIYLQKKGNQIFAIYQGAYGKILQHGFGRSSLNRSRTKTSRKQKVIFEKNNIKATYKKQAVYKHGELTINWIKSTVRYNPIPFSVTYLWDRYEGLSWAKGGAAWGDKKWKLNQRTATRYRTILYQGPFPKRMMKVSVYKSLNAKLLTPLKYNLLPELEIDMCIKYDNKVDRDGDGHVCIECGGDDCDDFNSNRFPGNIEVCDAKGVDEDCNYRTFGKTDQDRDGYVSQSCMNIIDGEFESGGRDCNDNRADVSPRNGEIIGNKIDDNCDGLVDEY